MAAEARADNAEMEKKFAELRADKFIKIKPFRDNGKKRNMVMLNDIHMTMKSDSYCNHIVDFNISPAIFAMDNGVSIHAENGDREPKAEIFRDYTSCKDYVNQLNAGIVEHYSNSKSAYRWRGCAEAKFKEVMEYAERLESQLIPAEERQDKDGLLSALESARGFN